MKRSETLAKGKAKKITDLKVRLARAEDEVKITAKHLEEAWAGAHACEVHLNAATTTFRAAWAACVEAHDEAQAAEKAKVAFEAECSFLRAEVLKISSKMVGRICDAMEEAMKRIEEAHIKKVR